MGVEWAERSEPADPHADARPGRRTPRGAADRGGLPAADEVVGGRDALVVLTDPERRRAEYRRYETIVHRALGPARGAGPPDQDSPPDADEPGSPNARDTPPGTWAQSVTELRAAWEKIKVKYDYAERIGPTPRPADGSWRGEGGQRLDAAQNADIDRGYARIREVGERAIIPVLREVEAEDPTRKLAGFEHRFKGTDRLKEKVADRVRTKGRSIAETLAQIPDVVRFTFQYSEAAYSAGVLRDVGRLEARGFTQVERRNTWKDEQYKGVNSRWREPESGVVFEVQFHTQASLEAKELTHKAYERLRSITGQTPEADQEASELKEFQRRVNSVLPIPPRVADIEEYPPEGA
ncbi:MAG: hypothetical protein ACRDNO_10675 [Trebonia sp.]